MTCYKLKQEYKTNYYKICYHKHLSGEGAGGWWRRIVPYEKIIIKLGDPLYKICVMCPDEDILSADDDIFPTVMLHVETMSLVAINLDRLDEF